jgi:predicted regulator of Ras-like GTPase activity (Roadblock/LC7/MglB family)
MQTILQQITAIDGVIGCSLYNDQGKILAAACPLILDDKQLGVAAGTVLDCLHALQITQTMVGLELRFSEGRLIVRPMAGAFLSVLCSQNVNTSMVTITLNLALRKIEQMLPKPGEVTVAAIATKADNVENGLSLRIAHLQKGDVSSSFDQLGMVAVTQATAKHMSDFFGKVSKKIKITTAAGGGGVFPVMVINDVEMQYDQALVIGPGIERKLKIEEGATVEITLA